MKDESEKVDAPAVGHGDHIYFQTGEGPKRGHVKAVGKHGVTAHADGKHHKVKHKHILGVAQRMDRQYRSVDAGEDGQIVEDDKGSRHYVNGQVPDAKRYADDAAEIEIPGDGELVTRAMEVAMRGIPHWQVVDGDLPNGSVVAGADKDQAQAILQAVESLDVPYEARARTVVKDGAEHHGVLLVFEPDADKIQDVVNAIASVQRKTALDTDEIMVFGRKVGGMDEMTISTKQIRGRTLAFVGEKKGMDQRKAYVSPDLASFSKGLNAGVRVMFFKDGIANKPGLALQNVTDKAGHQTQRWKKTGPDEKKGREAAAPKVDVGHHVAFDGHDGEQKQGKVVAAGKDGVTVQAPDGGEHRVEHHKVEHAGRPESDLHSLFTSEDMELPKDAEQKGVTADGKDKLYKLAAEALPKYKAWLGDLIQDHGWAKGGNIEDPAAINADGVLVFIAPLKGEDRAAEKAKADGGWHMVKDLVRGTIAVDSLDQLGPILDKLRASGMELARQPKNRYAKPTKAGYRDLMVNVMIDGHIAELQVNTKAMMVAKIQGHKHYEITRTIEETAEKEGRGLTTDEASTVEKEDAASMQIYKAAWDSLNKGVKSVMKKAILIIREGMKHGILQSLRQNARTA